MYKINDLYSDWLEGGIFSDLSNYDVPWGEEVDASVLDLQYHGNHSGNKYVSVLLDTLQEDGEISDSNRLLIAQSILAMYKNSWTRLYDLSKSQYEPLENYNMVENMTNDQTVHQKGTTSTRTDNLSTAKNGTDTETKNLTDTETVALTDTQTKNLTDQETKNLTDGKTGTETLVIDRDEVATPALTTTTDNTLYGFNSSVAVPTDSQTVENTGTGTTATDSTDTTTFNTSETYTGTDTTTHTGTDALAKTGTDTFQHTGTDAMQYNNTEAHTGTQAVAVTGSDTDTRNYELTRSGNIGVTTSQQMAQSEIELWKWNYFRDVVFRDIDRTLALRIY